MQPFSSDPKTSSGPPAGAETKREPEKGGWSIRATSKALVTSSDALVPSSFLLLLVRHLLLLAWHLLLQAFYGRCKVAKGRNAK